MTAYYVCLISFFQGCTVFLCDFHREQAWERWVTKTANNVSNCKDELSGRMREIAHAEDMTKFNAAVDKLKQLPVWNEKKPLRDWFVRTWLKQQKVLYFCPVSGSQSF